MYLCLRIRYVYGAVGWVAAFPDSAALARWQDHTREMYIDSKLSFTMLRRVRKERADAKAAAEKKDVAAKSIWSDLTTIQKTLEILIRAFTLRNKEIIRRLDENSANKFVCSSLSGLLLCDVG